MIITYLGGEFVKVQFGDTVLAFNPPSRDSKLKPARFGADIAMVTLNHPDMNGVETVTHGDRKPFVISGPGEYETKGVVIRGFPTSSAYGDGSERARSREIHSGKANTVYTVSLEGMKLCFLGALSSPELPAELKETLDEVDVLFLPIGGGGVLTPTTADKLAVSIEPRLIIPIHHEGLGDAHALKQFLKEAGEEGVMDKGKPQDKLTLKKKDLEGKEGEVIVLKAEQ